MGVGTGPSTEYDDILKNKITISNPNDLGSFCVGSYNLMASFDGRGRFDIVP